MKRDSEYKIKLLILYDILKKSTDENHALNTDEIIYELEKRNIKESRKVLPLDIATLNKYGYEVLSYKKKYHFYYVVSCPFDTAEVVMLADVVKASKLSDNQKNRLIEKLSGTLGYQKSSVFSNHMISVGSHKKVSFPLIYNVDSIERAINENKQISFRYFNYGEDCKKIYRKNGERYIANPIVMVWDKDNYYLLCYSNGHDGIVTYRLDKMDGVEIEETEREPYPEYELFNTEEYRKQVFSMFGGELQKVSLLFTDEIMPDIYDKFGDNIKVKKVDKNIYTIDVAVQVSKTFFAWIVGSQGKVKIKSPIRVIDKFNEFVAKIKEAY